MFSSFISEVSKFPLNIPCLRFYFLLLVQFAVRGRFPLNVPCLRFYFLLLLQFAVRGRDWDCLQFSKRQGQTVKKEEVFLQCYGNSQPVFGEVLLLNLPPDLQPLTFIFFLQK